MRLPLNRFGIAATRSIADTEAFLATNFHSIQIATVGRHDSFGWWCNRAVIAGVGLVVTGSLGALRSRTTGSEQNHCLMFTRAGSGRHKEPLRTMDLDRALMTPPAMARTIESSPGHVSTQVLIPQSGFDRMFHALTGSSGHVEFSMHAPPNVGSDVERFLEFVMGEADRVPNVLWTPTVTRRWVETLLHLLLTAWPHNLSSAFEKTVRPAEPRYLRRAEEYLTEHAGSALTYAELARHSGASVRALQSAFRIHRNSSPMAFLRERRFELARERLLTGAPESVASVALECGFTHLGRFSHDYRVRFGESPSQTVKRRGIDSLPMAPATGDAPNLRASRRPISR